MKKRLLIALLFAFIPSISALASYSFWSIADQAPTAVAGKQRIFPEKFAIAQLQQSAFENFQNLIPAENSQQFPLVLLPTPDGKMMEFKLFESPMMEAPLAAKYPQIKTYTAVSTADPFVTAKLDYTLFGFHAMVFNRNQTYFIDPLTDQKTEWYMVYYKSDFKKKAGELMTCHAEDDGEQIMPAQQAISLNEHPLPQNEFKTNGTDKRTYRLALACTVEYSDAVGGASPTKASVLSAMVTSVNRVNGVFERDFAMHCNLIANNDTLIFIGTTDPYSNSNGATMLGQNQTTINNRIGSANYDIGHVFSTGGGGIASLGSVCSSNSKAQGVTGSLNPVGDPFDIDYVAHEMGHQYGGSHTFNSVTGSCSGNRSGTSAYEIGSATTIMGYAGICGNDNIQSNSDDYYHLRSLEQMTNTNVIACASTVSSNNSIPTLAPISATYTIPYRTSFELTASGTDTDGDPLNYCWEEWDRGGSGSAWDAKTTVAPIFRSFFPTADPTRTFPAWKKLLQNVESYKGELLPDTNRTLRFRCTLRDMKNGYGSFYTSTDTVKLTVVKTPELFRVTSQDVPTQWAGWSNQTINWNIANTTASPISAGNVDIYLSIDSGKTWPFLLAANTPNDGSEIINVPNHNGTWCRVKVKGSGNVFFDLNDGWISITAVTAPAGLNDLDATALEIYPNPTQSSVMIKTADVRMNDAHIQICNTTGEIVLQSQLKNGSAQMDLEAIPAGVYMAFIINDQQQRIVKKIIKQ